MWTEEVHIPVRSETTDRRPPADDRNSDQTSRLTWIIPVGLLTGLIALYFAVPAFRGFIDEAYDVLSSGDRTEVQAWVEQFGPWGFVAIIGLMLFQTVVAFLPSLVTMVVSVLAYGPIGGGLLAWGGMLLAATLGYGIGRGFGPAIIGGLIADSTEQKLERFVDRYGSKGIVAARISPVLSTDAVSIVAGLVGMNYLKFIGATAAGTLPLAVLVAWLGASVDRLWPGLIAISIVSLVTFIGYVVWDQRRNGD